MLAGCNTIQLAAPVVTELRLALPAERSRMPDYPAWQTGEVLLISVEISCADIERMPQRQTAVYISWTTEDGDHREVPMMIDHQGGVPGFSPNRQSSSASEFCKQPENDVFSLSFMNTTSGFAGTGYDPNEHRFYSLRLESVDLYLVWHFPGYPWQIKSEPVLFIRAEELEELWQ
jgi:hypothetical protein